MDQEISIDNTTFLSYDGQWKIYYNNNTDYPLVSTIGYLFSEGAPIRGAFSPKLPEDLKSVLLDNFQVSNQLDDGSGIPCRPSSNGFQVEIDDDDLRFYSPLSSERCIIAKIRPYSDECIGCVVLFETNHLTSFYDDFVDEIISKFGLNEIKKT